jgi:hypothetical protein
MDKIIYNNIPLIELQYQMLSNTLIKALDTTNSIFKIPDMAFLTF